MKRLLTVLIVFVFFVTGCSLPTGATETVVAPHRLKMRLLSRFSRPPRQQQPRWKRSFLPLMRALFTSSSRENYRRVRPVMPVTRIRRSLRDKNRLLAATVTPSGVSSVRSMPIRWMSTFLISISLIRWYIRITPGFMA